MNKPKKKLLKLLYEALAAVEDAGRMEKHGGVAFNMANWHCGTACCVCGDVAMRRGGVNDSRDTERQIAQWCSDASGYSYQLDEAARDLMDYYGEALVMSIYYGSPTSRLVYAEDSGCFTDSEIAQFKHLTDETTRADAAIYIRAVIEKVEGY